MDRITGVMMSLLTGQVCGGEPPLPALTADEAAHLYALSKTYDLAHLAGSAPAAPQPAAGRSPAGRF